MDKEISDEKCPQVSDPDLDLEVSDPDLDLAPMSPTEDPMNSTELDILEIPSDESFLYILDSVF